MPNVSVLWNFFPLDLILWWPLKALLNMLVFPVWILSVPFYEIWNFLPTSAGIVLWILCTALFPIVVVFFIFFSAVFLGFTYLFTTSLPDLFVVFTTSVTAAGVIAGLTGGTFNFEKLGENAWLEGGDGVVK